MNKIHIDINKDKMIITVDILGAIDKSNIDLYIKQLDSKLKSISFKSDTNLNDWRFNIYTCHTIIYEDDLKSVKKFLDYCDGLNFKMIDIITAKPQKKYRKWIDDIIQKDFSNRHIKTLSTNNIFKFKLKKAE